MVAEILSLSNIIITKHAPIQHASIPIFCFTGQSRDYYIFFYKPEHVAAPPDTLFKLLTTTIGPRTSLLQCSDLHVGMHYRCEILGQNRGGSSDFDIPNELLLTFRAPKPKKSSKSNTNCKGRSDDRQTEGRVIL